MKKIFITVIICFAGFLSQAQYLAAFEDELNQFWVFEAGMFNLLEEEAITNFQIGGTLIAYLDGESDFKIYQYGQVQTLVEVAPIKYSATDYLLGYSLIDTLYAYDGEKITMLSNDCEEYVVKDSLIVWQTKREKALKIYYNGEIITIAEGLSDFQLDPKMTGDNIFAYVNSSTMEFVVFYRGELNVLDNYADGMNYQAGCDILAFMDITDQSFKVFYKGEIKKLDLFLPKSFKVGDQILAYIDQLENLKYFEEGELKTISSEPEFYEVKDHVMVFEEQGSFKTVCNDQVYIIEQYIPEPYYLDVNTIAWLENDESIRVFQHCEIITANKINVVKFNMVRNVIVFAEEEDETKVYFNGEVYENLAED